MFSKNLFLIHHLTMLTLQNSAKLAEKVQGPISILCRHTVIRPVAH